MPGENHKTHLVGGAQFPATRWTLIKSVRTGGPSAQEALAELCSRYWFPIFAFLRQQGNAREDAEDLTQGFFETLLTDGSLVRATPERGRLRSFLLHVLKQYMTDRMRYSTRKKRGGNAKQVGIDFQEGEERYCAELTDERDPEFMFHRAWALEIIATARTRLQSDYAAAGKAGHLEGLKPYLDGDESAVPYKELAAQQRMSETAMRVSVFRARQKLRSLVEEEIRATAVTKEEAEEELRWLLTMLSS